ncbi:hypothetical protein [Microbacterium sp. G2-8]|uniref:hypothetical protein n=1 Tax=Microbacterium sp. G2-8 TaxID=2842454 RepID=UPI001C8A6AA6|nr:hypothetical protein [Microbacterium sp. G2-8]
MIRRLAVVAASAAAVLLLATGCSGDREENDAAPPPVDFERYDPDDRGNGVWLIPPQEAITQITGAVRDAGAVTMSGAVRELVVPEDDGDPSPGRLLSVVYEGSAGEMRAELDADGTTARVIASGGDTYVTGNARYAEQSGIADVDRGWVCVESPEVVLSDWEPLLDPADVVRTLLTSSESVAVMEPEPDAETTTVSIGTGDSPIGEMTIAAADAPLPRAFSAGDASGDGAFRFESWGEQPEIEPPGNVLRRCAES